MHAIDYPDVVNAAHIRMRDLPCQWPRSLRRSVSVTTSSSAHLLAAGLSNRPPPVLPFKIRSLARIDFEFRSMTGPFSKCSQSRLSLGQIMHAVAFTGHVRIVVLNRPMF